MRNGIRHLLCLYGTALSTGHWVFDMTMTASQSGAEPGKRGSAMWRIPRTYQFPRHAGASAKLVLLLVAFAAALSAVATAGCTTASTTPSTPATVPASDLHFVLDGNYLAAKSNSDLRTSLVALVVRNGRVAWRHALEGSSATDATYTRYQPVELDGLVYLSYYYEHAPDPQDVVRHGVVEALEAATGKTLWRREVGTEVNGAPVLDGPIVYVSALVMQAQTQVQSGLLEALDVRSGAVRWQRALDASPSMAAGEDGRIFVIANHQFSGHLLALDASNGSVAWDFASDAPISGGSMQSTASNAPLVIGGRVYVQAVERSADGTAKLKLIALDARSGSVAWQFQTNGLTAAPSFDQSSDTICFTEGDQAGRVSSILGLAPSNGTPRWSMTDVPGSVSGCAASGDTFYLTQRSSDLKTGSVFALSSRDGRQLWKTPTNSPVIAAGPLAPAVASGVVGVYLEGPPATNGPPMTTMAVVQASDGKLLWRHDFDGRPDQVLDIEGNLILNPESSGKYGVTVIVAYARDSGAPLWTYALGHL